MAFNVSYIYQVKDKFSAPIRRFQKHVGGASRSMRKFGEVSEKASSKLANMRTVITGFAASIGGARMLDTFVGFEESINKLGAVSLASSAQMDKFKNKAKELGIATQFSASQVAQGMIYLKMAGLTTEQTLKAIGPALQLAAAGGIELAAAADIATNVMAQFSLKVSELNRVNDVLAVVQANANTNITEMAEALKNTGTTASSLGLTLEQTTAMLGAMANAGVKAGEAGTLLRNALMRAVNPSKKALKSFQELGININKFRTPEGKLKNFAGLIEILQKRGATTAQIFNIFEERGGRAIQALMTQGKPAIDALTKSLEKSGGAAEKMAKIQMKGMPGAIKAAKSAWEGFQIALFESGFAEMLKKMFDKLTVFLRAFSKSNPTLLKWIAIIGAVVMAITPLLVVIGLAASGVSALTFAVSGLGLSFAAIAWPILAIVAVIGAAVFIWQKFIRHTEIGKKIAAAAAVIFRGFGNAIAWTFNKMMELVGGLIKGVQKVYSLITAYNDYKLATAGAQKAQENLNQSLARNAAIKREIAKLPATASREERLAVAREVTNRFEGNMNANITVAAEKGSQVKNMQVNNSPNMKLGVNMAGG